MLSSKLGIYVTFIVVSSGRKVPEPILTHCPEVVVPPTTPLNVTILLFAQTVILPLACAHGEGKIVTVNESVTAGQPLKSGDAKTKSIVEEAVSAGLKLYVV